MLSKISNFINAIKKIKNWWMYFLDYLHLLKLNNKYTLHFRNGIKILFRSGTTDRGTINEIIFKKMYTPQNLIFNHDDTIIDIGAHIGIFSIYASSKARNGKIFCYEPNKENYNILKQNIAINYFKNVKTFNYAVAGKNGKRKLYIHSVPDCHNFFMKDSGKYDTIQCVTLTDIIENNNIKKINLLKLDCEGCEYEIIYNLKDKYFRIIDYIILEYHQKLKTHNPSQLINFLKNKKYIVYKQGFMIYAKKKKY